MALRYPYKGWRNRNRPESKRARFFKLFNTGANQPPENNNVKDIDTRKRLKFIRKRRVKFWSVPKNTPVQEVASWLRTRKRISWARPALRARWFSTSFEPQPAPPTVNINIIGLVQRRKDVTIVRRPFRQFGQFLHPGGPAPAPAGRSWVAVTLESSSGCRGGS